MRKWYASAFADWCLSVWRGPCRGLPYWRWSSACMRGAAAVLLFATASLPLSANVDDISRFPYTRPIKTDGTAEWYQINLPASVLFNAAHADLRDLRVFNAQGEALPYALVLENVQRREEEQQTLVKRFPLYASDDADHSIQAAQIRRDAQGNLIDVVPAMSDSNKQQHLRGWLLDTSKLSFPFENLHLKLKEPAEGLHRFEIEASDDLSHWRSWGEGQIVRITFNGERIDQRDIRLPGIHANYLRLIWQVPGTAPILNEVRISGSRAVHEPAHLTWSPLLEGERVADAENDIFVWKLPVSLPVERVRVNGVRPNTLAPVVLSGRNVYHQTPTNLANVGAKPSMTTEPPWKTLASGVFYRLPMQDGHEMQQEELPLNGAYVDELRLMVDRRGGGLGEAAPQLSVAIAGRQLVFQAHGSAPYRLAYGLNDVNSAALPLAMLIPMSNTPTDINRPDVGRASVIEGTARQPPAIVAHKLQALRTPPPAPAKENESRLVLWFVLCGGAILLLAIAYVSLKQGSDIRRQMTDDRNQ